MLNQVFQSVFSQSSVTVSPQWLLLSLLVSLGLGFALARLYRYQGNGSRDFAVTLVVLPSLIAVVIFLVNGNLGTSVAVAGAFSLIKFRSPASSSRELLLVFMATAVGLATGMGYLFLAMTVTFLVAGAIVLLEGIWYAKKDSLWQEVTVVLPKEPKEQAALHRFFLEMQVHPVLESIKVRTQEIECTYQLQLHCPDQELVARLLEVDSSWKISLSRSSKKKKSL